MNDDEAATSGESSGVHIKREPVDDSDIKDFAETTMNELLGWYGYGKVDSRDTQGLNLHRFTAAGSPPPHHHSSPDDDERDHSPTRGGGSPCSSNGGNSKATEPPANLPPGYVVCAWCQKVGMKLFTLKTATGQKAFCSELCFTQCRRASFKKNKVCDWCKHIRHTVNYVDFQDGEQQLQFCSNKCLNQYKMNIFCRETQAHLQMHPHLQDAAKLAAGGGPSAGGSGVTLITPDLWLRDCHSSHDSGINGHDGKASDNPTPAPPSTSTAGKDEDDASCGVKQRSEKHHKGSSSSSRKGGLSGLGRHHARLREKHRRHRSLHKSTRALLSSSARRHALNVRVADPVPSTAPSLTSPKSSSGQPSPNVPGNLQLGVGTSPLSSGPRSMSPHPPAVPTQLLAAAAAANAAKSHQHHSVLNPADMTRPPFVPPLGPHYPFLGQLPGADMLMRLPHAGMRPGNANGPGGQPAPLHPFPFPPGFGFPFGMQPMPGSGPGPSQGPGAVPPPNPLLNPMLSSLLPPMAVLVPYPVVLPIPIPIPIPLPIPIPGPDFFKKAAAADETSPKSTVTPHTSSGTTTRPSSVTNTATAASMRESASRSLLGKSGLGRFARHSLTPHNSISGTSFMNTHTTTAAKRVDSVITRLTAPKLSVQSSSRRLMDIPHQMHTLRRPLMSSSISTLPPLSSLHESSSDQSNGLDDSTDDISDFPDSDALDMDGGESDDSRQSDGDPLPDVSSRSYRAASGLSLADMSSPAALVRTSPPGGSGSSGGSASSAFPALPARDRRGDVGTGSGAAVEETLSHESLDPTSEPEMKRKCLRTRLTAK